MVWLILGCATKPIIGESVRRDYMSVYGYPHPTTPWLNKANGTFINGMVSMGPNTVSSLSRTLQHSSEKNYSEDTGFKLMPENNIITLANKAKYRTHWISNQGMLGVHDTSTSTVAIKSNKSFFLNYGNYNERNKDDLEMLIPFEKILEEKTKGSLIVMHMLGSHPNTCKRLHGFPNNFQLDFTDAFTCYLASIEKTDDFIKRTIDILSKNGSYSLIYLSDHGMFVDSESVRVSSNFQSNYDVPLFLLNSDAKEHYMVNKRISGKHFIDIYASWLGVTISPESQIYNFKYPEKIPENKGIKVYNFEKMVNISSLDKQPALY